MALTPCKHGHFSRRGAQNKCLECSRNRAKKVRTENPEHVKKVARAYCAANREKLNKKGRQYYHSNVKRTMIRHARKRALEGGYPCTVIEADIQIPEFCPLLGIKIITGGKLTPGSPSLDKIIPALGYVPGNVWVVSHRANALKGDATLGELKLLVANLENRCTLTPAPQERMPWAP